MNGGSSPRLWFGSNAVTVRSSKSAPIRAQLCGACTLNALGSPAPDLFSRLHGLELTTPFLFARTGFATRELEAHVEGRETWRALEVTYPDDVPAHTKVQKLYLGDDLMLRRLDYVTDVLGGVAAHYGYEHVTIDGLVFPTLRRVVRRTPEGPLRSGRTSFILDDTNLVVRK